jgi:uncharacterized phage-associated protein
METSQATRLAAWIVFHYPYRAAGLELTHPKLQRLCFYAAGVAWATGAGSEFGGIEFEAWKHGPVLREVYATYHHEKGAIAARSVAPAPFGEPTERALHDAVTVYGLLSAWGLRAQAHHEAPWIQANADGAPAITRGEIETHFRRKWADGVACPESLADRGIFTFDASAIELRLVRFAGCPRASLKKAQRGRGRKTITSGMVKSWRRRVGGGRVFAASPRRALAPSRAARASSLRSASRRFL